MVRDETSVFALMYAMGGVILLHEPSIIFVVVSEADFFIFHSA